MHKVVVRQFGDIDQLEYTESPTPTPGDDQVLVRITSIGMNHAELMQRRGEYKITSGDPPFTPGLEGGGIVEAVGGAVTHWQPGDRALLGVDATRRAAGGDGSYQSHFITSAEKLVAAPDALPDEQLGAIWLPYLTAWGCLVWRQGVEPGQTALVPAASSSVGIAASQLLADIGCTVIGTTTSPKKVEQLQAMPEAKFDHLVVTRDRPWWKDVKQITDGRGCDVIFDPVAAGDFLNSEIRLLANGGTLWVYGLLGETGPVDVTPLIRLNAAIRGWALTELAELGGDPLQTGYRYVLDRLADGRFKLPVAQTFALSDVRNAHRVMETGGHIGKLILVP
jgi:NADPH2:quinone reductase